MIEDCCESMAGQLDWECDHHTDPFDCPDALIHFAERFVEYGLIVHDGGSSSITISFCPWCGTRLPESQRDRWFDALEALGVDPWNDDIPAEYQDGRWLRS
ncbi:hypothetical protein Misp01_67310 [Microtetraspora sp. NBRC 13810]|uniref:DUF6980 family protein n=1 Tax=Microtetraspora sp. NBRC 13810 TaxID=3030990 RepID=UPI0024A14D5C|nr:hypothetical protein [Microtetraspora sp. NBRC 13810]GLW11603.1 hypothetical protein Misp01_67310 [Microtetraspora sp. NBRC 13810]